MVKSDRIESQKNNNNFGSTLYNKNKTNNFIKAVKMLNLFLTNLNSF